MADFVPIPSGSDGPEPAFAEGSGPEHRSAPEPAFADLVEAWHGELYGFALCLAGDADEAARLTRLAFQRWIELGGSRVPRGEARRWLFAALYREFARAADRRGDAVPEGRRIPRASAPAPAAAERIQRLRPMEIVAALQRVGRAARIPLAFMYAGNFTAAEIAEILELPPAEMMGRLAGGKAELARALGAADEAPAWAAAG